MISLDQNKTISQSSLKFVITGHFNMVTIFIFIRYSSKYRNTKNRLRELGLLDSNFTGSIFTLDEWEIPREKLVLNRKLGEGAFGAVFGGEGLKLMGSAVSVPVAVKTLRVGATIEDKVSVSFKRNMAKRIIFDCSKTHHRIRCYPGFHSG